MSQLIIDIGNSLIKTVIYSNDRFEAIQRHNIDESFFDFLTQFKTTPTIISSVNTKEYTTKVAKALTKVIVLDANTSIPIKNNYKTPKTLGKDRLANAIAANNQYPNENNLIIDLGTCLKFDFIDHNNCYLGGSISLGFNMKYKALHNFTANLPLYQNETAKNLLGTDTKSAIVSGVHIGLLGEIKHTISLYEDQYKQLNIFLTGGDLSHFENEVLSQKNSIFVAPLLTIKGLKVILDYNE